MLTWHETGRLRPFAIQLLPGESGEQARRAAKYDSLLSLVGKLLKVGARKYKSILAGYRENLVNPEPHEEEMLNAPVPEDETAPVSASDCQSTPSESESELELEPLPEIDYSPPKPNQKFNRLAFFLLFLLTIWVLAGIASGGIYLMGRVLQHIIR